MGVGSVEQLEALFAAHGANTLYVKHLAANQDNEKNQIYFGGGMGGVLNLFQAKITARSASESTLKRKSSLGQAKLEAKLDFAWLSASGEAFPAPNARIIDYFQYPEIRFSGFLKGCKQPPDALRRDHQDGYGRRILVLGTRPDDVVVGYVLTEKYDPLVADFPKLPELPAARIFHVLVVGGAGREPLDLLRERLEAIADAGWHPSVILKPGNPAPVAFAGSQGAGYTLEALLGVSANANKAPDSHGFEIKSFGSSRISLMTPTPDAGFQGDHTFREFMGRYGRPGLKGDGSRRFTGTHKSGIVCARTGLVLEVRGYDPKTDSFGEADQVMAALVNPATGEVAASWSVEHLANCWNAKHASAAYIRYRQRKEAAGRSYSYSRSILVGQGTDVWRLFRAIHRGLVYYDPADTIYADGQPKVRSQWRTDARTLPETMKTLYAEASEILV
jgi:hypothetical protein